MPGTRKRTINTVRFTLNRVTSRAQCARKRKRSASRRPCAPVFLIPPLCLRRRSRSRSRSAGKFRTTSSSFRWGSSAGRSDFVFANRETSAPANESLLWANELHPVKHSVDTGRLEGWIAVEALPWAKTKVHLMKTHAMHRLEIQSIKRAHALWFANEFLFPLRPGETLTEWRRTRALWTTPLEASTWLLCAAVGEYCASSRSA